MESLQLAHPALRPTKKQKLIVQWVQLSCFQEFSTSKSSWALLRVSSVRKEVFNRSTRICKEKMSSFEVSLLSSRPWPAEHKNCNLRMNCCVRTSWNRTRRWKNCTDNCSRPELAIAECRNEGTLNNCRIKYFSWMMKYPTCLWRFNNLSRKIMTNRILRRSTHGS